MIGVLKGKVELKKPFFVTVDVNGVGYEVNVPISIASDLKIGDETKLFVRTVYRENYAGMFGFASYDEREIFDLLVSVSGVGPKTGLMILSSMDKKEVVTCLSSGNVDAFKKVKGIGNSTAQNLVVNLKDKVEKFGISAGETVVNTDYNPNINMAADALVTLGYKKKEALAAVKKAIKEKGMQDKVEDLILISLC